MNIIPALKVLGARRTRGLLLIEQVGAPLPRSGFLGKIDLHGELLDADVGMRTQPEAFTVLTILDPQRRTGQIDIAGTLDG